MCSKGIGVALIGLLMSTVFVLPARATPVTFDIAGFSFTHGSGHGVDAGKDNNPALLDARFGVLSVSIRTFNSDLSRPVSSSVLFGTLSFEELNTPRSIPSPETDNCGVMVDFTITTSAGGGHKLTVFGTAKTCPVWDEWMDDTAFGKGGKFVISLNDRSSKGHGW